MVSSAQLIELLQQSSPPCVSLYQPTHRTFPENQQDPIRFKNLVREVHTALEKEYPKHEAKSLTDKLQTLAANSAFWNQRTDGLAIFCSPDRFDVYDVERTVPELAVVADSYHIKPLIRVVQTAGRYQLLCLRRHEVKLYEGNRYVLEPLDMADIPATIEEALGAEVTEPYITHHSVGTTAGQRIDQRGHGAPGGFSGQGARKDEIDIDAERYFRAVDRAVREHHSQPSGLPLLIAGASEHHSIFRVVSRNPQLLDTGMMIDPFEMPPDKLRDEAWQLIEPIYRRQLASLIDEFNAAKAHGKGTDNLEEAAKAMSQGRIGRLLVEWDRHIPGTIDPAGNLQLGDANGANLDDVLDDLAEGVLRQSGNVTVLPSDRMPTDTGLAAIYRY